jgi:hypothetical protein
LAAPPVITHPDIKPNVEKVRTEDPATYLRIAAMILPKELDACRQ